MLQPRNIYPPSVWLKLRGRVSSLAVLMLVLPRNRPLSAVSTDAAATPSLDDQCLELSPEQSRGSRVGIVSESCQGRLQWSGHAWRPRSGDPVELSKSPGSARLHLLLLRHRPRLISYGARTSCFATSACMQDFEHHRAIPPSEAHCTPASDCNRFRIVCLGPAQVI